MINFRFLILNLVLLAPAVLLGATAPAYTNKVVLVSPPATAPNIDATLFVNQAYFEVNDFRTFQPLPYETLNTLHFINEASGTMAGSPGYRFDYFRPNNNSRSPMSSWINRNLITTDSTNQFFFANTAQWLLISATNILNTGLLNAGPQSLIRVDGKTVNLSRSRLRTGTSTNFFGYSGGFNLFSTNYFNDLGVSDVYWASGSSNVVGGMGALMQLNVPGFFPSFSPPYRSPFHEVVETSLFGSLFTNQLALGDFFFENNVFAAAYSNQIGGEIVIQAVFVKTNAFEPNITTEVRFVNDFQDNGRTVVVGFHSRDRDVALDRDVTNSVYILDALAFETNVVLARNLTASTRKPTTYEVTKGLNFTSFTFTNQTLPNVVYTNTLLYRSNFVDSAVGVQYTAYAADVASFSLNPAAGGALNDPTNFPGRIEIFADTLNLKETRIRSDSTLIVQADNLVSNGLARINAPFISFDVGTTQPTLVISNLAPVSVNRLSGGIQAYSATWRNTEVIGAATNNWRFHVLFVDNTLTTNQPVSLNKFHVRAPNLVVCDPINVQQSIRLEGNSVHVKTNGALVFPPNTDWSASTVVNVLNFTNEGRVSVPGGAFLGFDRGFGYDNVINRGTNDAAVWSILTDRFENRGCFFASGGAFELSANRVLLEGRPPFVTSNFVFNFSTFEFEWQVETNYAAKIAAVTDVNITGSSVTLSNAHLVAGSGGAPGAVIISASTRLTDAGPQHTSHWITTGGIRAPRRPTQSSDLIGTHALVKAPPFGEAQNVWDGKNLGAVSLGYSNNLALGKLTLDGGEASRFRFVGLVGKDNGIYVDYLELLNNATNYTDPEVLAFDQNVVLYFAHANITASKLDGAQADENGFGARIRWVRGFTGPLSSTNIVYPSGAIYTVNTSLAQDKDLDSDGDGTVNSKDPTPVFSPESIELGIGRDPAQANRVLLSWRALANSTSYIEYKPLITSSAWQLLRSTTAPANMRLTTTDTTAGRTQRIYRVRMDLPPQ